jgi:hypothetical protein
VADPAQPGLIAYFLKFPNDDAARGAIPGLEALGFGFNPEYTAAFAEDGEEGWLVVERGDDVSDIECAEDALSEVADKHGGTYDGWEAGVG